MRFAFVICLIKWEWKKFFNVYSYFNTIHKHIRTLQDGTTPLHWAVKIGNIKLMMALLKHGAEINRQDKVPAYFTVCGAILCIFQSCHKQMNFLKCSNCFFIAERQECFVLLTSSGARSNEDSACTGRWYGIERCEIFFASGGSTSLTFATSQKEILNRRKQRRNCKCCSGKRHRNKSIVLCIFASPRSYSQSPARPNHKLAVSWTQNILMLSQILYFCHSVRQHNNVLTDNSN